MNAHSIHGEINRSLIWNHKDRGDRKGMRSRFLLIATIFVAFVVFAVFVSHGWRQVKNLGCSRIMRSGRPCSRKINRRTASPARGRSHIRLAPAIAIL
jgi:hypothetical protein